MQGYTVVHNHTQSKNHHFSFLFSDTTSAESPSSRTPTLGTLTSSPTGLSDGRVRRDPSDWTTRDRTTTFSATGWSSQYTRSVLCFLVLIPLLFPLENVVFFLHLLHIFKMHFRLDKGAQWLSGRVLDSRPKGGGFKPHQRHCVVVLEQDTFILA